MMVAVMEPILKCKTETGLGYSNVLCILESRSLLLAMFLQKKMYTAHVSSDTNT